MRHRERQRPAKRDVCGEGSTTEGLALERAHRFLPGCLSLHVDVGEAEDSHEQEVHEGEE